MRRGRECDCKERRIMLNGNQESRLCVVDFDSMEMSKLREIVEDTETWRDRDARRAAVHGVTKSRT